MLPYVKRLIRYVLNGQPVNEVVSNVQSITNTELLRGKRIIVTGGGRGLGLSIAKKCLDYGANVVISGRNEVTLVNACNSNKHLKYIVADINNISSHEEFIQQCEYILGGKCDSLINNAGISLHEGWYGGVTEESWDLQFNTNLKSPYFLSQRFIEHIDDSNDSKKNIIFISSERGLYGDDIPYGLIKAAINSLTAGLGRRLLNKNIFVNAVAPGVTASDMTGYNPDGNLYRPQACSKRVYLPEEVAEVTAFLISDAAKCISSQVIPTQNGNHLRCDW